MEAHAHELNVVGARLAREAADKFSRRAALTETTRSGVLDLKRGGRGGAHCSDRIPIAHKLGTLVDCGDPGDVYLAAKPRVGRSCQPLSDRRHRKVVRLGRSLQTDIDADERGADDQPRDDERDPCPVLSNDGTAGTWSRC